MKKINKQYSMFGNVNMKVKQVYGKDLIYPDCAKSQLLAELLRKKTFNSKELQILVKLGYAITLNGHVPEDLEKTFDPKDYLINESFRTADMWDSFNMIEFISYEQPDNITCRGMLCGLRIGDRIRSKMESGKIGVYEIIEIDYSAHGDRFWARLKNLGSVQGEQE